MRAREPPGERLRFGWAELSGSLGDLGTFLPLVVGMTFTCHLDLGAVLVLAGAMNVATGVLFGQPLPVQPMKAIAAVAITERLTAPEIAAAGMAMGVALLLLAATGLVDRLAARIPNAVVRGIQLGIGARLVVQGAAWLDGLGAASLLVAAGTAALLWGAGRSRMPVLLGVFTAGFGLLWVERPEAFAAVGFGWPVFAIDWPTPAEWVRGALRAGLPQLPLTLLNSVVAVCALSSDYFPGRGIAPRRMAASVALMNLACVPLGGLPMCHGAGGLAAQHRFGARTGGSVVMLGAAKILVGLSFGATIAGVLDAYPRAILAVLLALAGITLAAAARDELRSGRTLVVVAAAAATVGVNALAGFLAGVGLALLDASWRRRRASTPRDRPRR